MDAIETAAVAIFHNNEGEPVDQWGDLYQREREAYTDQARAAIAAYLEATGVERDAERYRWLRELDVEIVATGVHIAMGFCPEELDAAIDTARDVPTSED